MTPKRRDPTDPREWLRRAQSNLARARAGRNSPQVLYEDLCFDAQQAAEKALKALLVHQKVAFPRTHAIMDLLSLLQQNTVTIPEEIRRAGLLVKFESVRARF